MPTSSLEETLAAAGYAKVLVILTPKATAAIGGVARGTNAASAGAGSATRRAEAAIESHFIIPSEAQVESLAMSARRAASRRFRRPEALTTRKVRIYPHLGLALGFADADGVAALEADGAVAKVVKAPELSLIRPVAARHAKLTTTPSWGVMRLKAERLWAAGYRGQGVVVGHLDTGVDGAHPALTGAIAAFAEFDMAGDQVPNAKPTDSDSHGTHTAGTIVGRSGKKGAFGMAPEARLASAMVIEGGQVIDRILAGMDWVVDQGVRIMSMSLGLRGYTPAFQAVIDALRAADVLPVIAVGNERANTSRSPGNYANVLSVGAMDAKDAVADFSGSQHFNRPDDPLVPDVVAPGVATVSSVPGGGFEEMDGSSMATPHVAGLAALLLSAKPDATANELERAILGSCSRPARMPEARGNRGVPDAVAAFRLLTGAPLPAAVAKMTARRGSRRASAETAPMRGRAKRSNKTAAPKGKKKQKVARAQGSSTRKAARAKRTA